jgi:hypothetical protein
MQHRTGKTLSFLTSFVCLVVMHISTLAAQTTKPVAYIYVSQSPVNPGPNQVLGFAAAGSGKLTKIEGSPFRADVGMMAVNGRFLLGSATNELYLESYSIEENGSLRFAVANDIAKITHGADTYAYTAWLALDHSGNTLYALRDVYGVNDNYEAFVVNRATGSLTMPSGFIMGAGDNDSAPGQFTMSANDKFMFGPNCGWAGQSLSLYNRAANGALQLPQAALQQPAEPLAADGYRFCPWAAAADPSNHVAVAYQNWDDPEGPEDGPNQLGVYTFAANGSLTTTSTYQNMPTVAVGDVNSLRMAPSGKVLAVLGTTGLQIFHFNGSAPITPYATLVSDVSFGEGFWDNANHLFTIGSNGQLYVFTVTPTGVSQAPGSPYSIPNAQYLIVQPLPL